MNNKMRKEVKALIGNEIFLYNFHVKEYYRYKDVNPVRCDTAVEHCRRYLHSVSMLIDSLNICDSSYDYFLKFESRDFYSCCSLEVEKVEG